MAEDDPGWTLNTLHLHHQRQHDDLKVLMDERFETQNRSLASALDSINARLAAANEIRAAWQDDRANLPTRAEVDARLKPLEEANSTASGRRAGANETRTGLRLDTGWVFAAIAAVGAIVAFLSK